MWFPLLLACANPPPEGVDALMSWLWDAYDASDDAALIEGAEALHETLGGATEQITGDLPDLRPDQVAALRPGVDPEPASGVFLANPIVCDLETMEALLITTEWDELYDLFTYYDRRYTSDLDAWRAREGEPPLLRWDVTYGASIPLAGEFLAEGFGEVRALQSDALGEVLAVRSGLSEPAVFDSEGPTFDQDWRLELYYAPDGEVVHIEGLWRHMDAGIIDTDSDVIQTALLDGLADWDAQSAAHCEAGWR